MNNALFISEALLRTFTDIGNNYNKRTLQNAVLAAQGDLKDVIGKALHDRLRDDIIAGTAFTGLYLELINERISPFLIQRSYWYMLETIFITPRNNGLGQISSSANFTTATQDVYYQKRKSSENMIADFERELKEFLTEHYEAFTELSDDVDIPSDEPNFQQSSVQGPVIISSRRRNGNR